VLRPESAAALPHLRLPCAGCAFPRCFSVADSAGLARAGLRLLPEEDNKARKRANQPVRRKKRLITA